MQTHQATLILASLQRSPRGFQSYDLSKPARQCVDEAQRLLGEYQHRLSHFDHVGALAKVEQAYHLLRAVPPPATPEDMDEGTHPMMLAVGQADQAAETEAWRVFLSEMLEG
jgi:hypothetical protein